MAPSSQLRLVALLGLLLPSLLLPQGGTLRVCLHSWIDLSDGCVECVTPQENGCCRELPVELSLSDAEACATCCYALSTSDTDVLGSVSQADGPELPAAPQPVDFVVAWVPEHRVPVLRPTGACSRPGPLLVPLLI